MGPGATELWPAQHRGLLMGRKTHERLLLCEASAARADSILIQPLLYSRPQLANKADVSIKTRALGNQQRSGPADENLCSDKPSGRRREGPDPPPLFNAAHIGFPPSGSHHKLLSIKVKLRKITISAIMKLRLGLLLSYQSSLFRWIPVHILRSESVLVFFFGLVFWTLKLNFS